MPNRKVLKGIKPFNKFSFKTCYYHQLISVYSYFGIDESVLISNYLPVYGTTDKKILPAGKELNIFSIKEMEEKTGIREIVEGNTDDIISEAIACIDNNSPIIVAVDTFYLDYRRDACKEQHLCHYILLYGYDKTEKEFTATEHYYINSFNYKECKIPFAVIENAFTECKKIMQDNSRLIVKFKRIKKMKPVVDGNVYLELYKSNAAKLENSFNCLKNAVSYIKEKLKSERNFRKAYNDMLTFFETLKWQKLYQRNTMSMFFGMDSDIYEWVTRIMENFVYVHGVIVKTYYTKSFEEKSVGKIVARIDEVLALEQRVHSILAGVQL